MKCYRILQFYIYLVVLYKIISLQFFIYILILYSWVCPQSVLYDVLKFKTLERLLQSPIQLAPAVIVTRPDETGTSGYKVQL